MEAQARQEGMRQAEEQRLASVEDDIELSVGSERTYSGAKDLLNAASEELFGDTLRVIEQLVSQGLRRVLGEPSLSLELEQRVSRGKVAVRFNIVSLSGAQKVTTDVLSARGGGLAAVVGFFVQLVLLLASGSSRVLVLDETFAHLSAEFEPVMAEVLADMSEKMGVQIILVTHSPTYAEFADSVHTFALVDGVTEVV